MAKNGRLCNDAVRQRMASVKHIILVLSGKGGVGKSTVATQLALGLMMSQNDTKVGILDIDLCGPSVPRMLGVEDAQIYSCPDGWVPVYKFDQRLAIMSIGFLLGDGNEAVVWRGPKKTAMIQQFIADVCWGELDYLVIDTPPGTSDEHLAVVECVRQLRPDGAVLVTTPQGLSLSDVMREATFCKKAKLNILGLIENMSGFVCPHCSECSKVFSSGGGERLASAIPCPFLGRLPLDPNFGRTIGNGDNFLEHHPDNPVSKSIMSIARSLREPRTDKDQASSTDTTFASQSHSI